MSSGESCACAVPSERPKMVPSTHPVIRTAANPRPIAHSLLKHALIKFPLTANVKSSAQPHARAPTGCRTPSYRNRVAERASPHCQQFENC
jgi:hypothetical protein